MEVVAERKPNYRRRVLLGIVCLGGGLLTSLCGAQAPAANPAPAADATHKIDDTWQGTLHIAQANRDLRMVLKVAKDDKGALKATTYSIDQNGAVMPVDSASFDSGTFKFTIPTLDVKYEGKMSSDGKSIAGTFTQGAMTTPLLFERATPETEWAIPAPPPKLPPMAADANPSFEVATIKPTQPGQQGKGINVQGSHFRTRNTSVSDLIAFSYGIQQKQIVGAPDWVDTDKWDIEAQPDVPGVPDRNQVTTMIQKLLADRFQLKFHNDTREMSAYILTVSKTGNKMTKGDQDAPLPGLGFMNLSPVTLGVRNATMDDFARFLQQLVLDKPVVDQTALTEKWNFLLKWTADESQLGGLGMKIPPPSDAADAPPPLYTAIQEQLGLKLEAGKTQVKAYVIDKVAKPSDN